MNDDDFDELFKQLSSGRSTDTSWREIAGELESLGNTLGAVLRRAWQDPDANSGLSQLRDVVASAIDELNRTVDGTPEAASARDQLKQLVESLQETANRATAELRPQILSMLRQANEELRRRSGLYDEG